MSKVFYVISLSWSEYSVESTSMKQRRSHTKSRFSEEQIIHVLKAHEAGTKAADICHRLGISEQAFYRWKAIFGGLEVSNAWRLKHWISRMPSSCECWGSET